VEGNLVSLKLGFKVPSQFFAVIDEGLEVFVERELRADEEESVDCGRVFADEEDGNESTYAKSSEKYFFNANIPHYIKSPLYFFEIFRETFYPIWTY